MSTRQGAVWCNQRHDTLVLERLRRHALEYVEVEPHEHVRSRVELMLGWLP